MAKKQSGKAPAATQGRTSLRSYLSGVKKDLDAFMAAAGRRNATITALIGQIDATLASGDRALDVADPVELSRGYAPPSAEQ